MINFGPIFSADSSDTNGDTRKESLWWGNNVGSQFGDRNGEPPPLTNIIYC